MSSPIIHLDVNDRDSVARGLNSYAKIISDLYRPSEEKTSYTLIRKNVFPTRNLLSYKNIIRNIENIIRLKIDFNVTELDFYCDSIIIKSNLRIQNLNRTNVSVKLYSHKKNRSLSGEVEARKILKEKVPGIRLAPELINYDEADAGWIVEEYVELALFQHSKIRKLVRDLLPKLYGNTCSQDRFAIEGFPFLQNTRNTKIKDLIETFTSKNYSLPHAYCHGDMTKSNILKDTKGNVLISDWENAGYRPILTDLSRLYLHHKDVRDEIISLLDSCSGQDRKSIPSRLQIAIGLEAFLNAIAENAGGKLSRKQRKTDMRGRVLIEELLGLESAPHAG